MNDERSRGVAGEYENLEGVDKELRNQLADLIEERMEATNKKPTDKTNEDYWPEDEEEIPKEKLEEDKETLKDNEQEEEPDLSLPPTEELPEIPPPQEDKDEGYHSGDEEQKKEIQQNAKYRSVAIKLANDSQSGEKEKRLAKIISTNIKDINKIFLLFIRTKLYY